VVEGYAGFGVRLNKRLGHSEREEGGKKGSSELYRRQKSKDTYRKKAKKSDHSLQCLIQVLRLLRGVVKFRIIPGGWVFGGLLGGVWWSGGWWVGGGVRWCWFFCGLVWVVCGGVRSVEGVVWGWFCPLFTTPFLQ